MWTTDGGLLLSSGPAPADPLAHVLDADTLVAPRAGVVPILSDEEMVLVVVVTFPVTWVTLVCGLTMLTPHRPGCMGTPRRPDSMTVVV